METKNKKEISKRGLKAIDIIINIWTTLFFIVVCSIIYIGYFYNIFWGYIAALTTCPLLHIFLKKIISDKYGKVVLSIGIRVILILFCFFACRMYGKVYAFNMTNAQIYITEKLGEKYKGDASYKFIDGYLETSQYDEDDEYIEIKATVNYELQEQGKEKQHNEEILAKFNRKTGEFSLSE